jgi:hypothetical protein
MALFRPLSVAVGPVPKSRTQPIMHITLDKDVLGIFVGPLGQTCICKMLHCLPDVLSGSWLGQLEIYRRSLLDMVMNSATISLT